MVVTGYRDLALLKINVLLHDPLNKSFLIEQLGSQFRDKHREIAKIFLHNVLGETSLHAAGLREELEKIVVEADSIASSFDRWVLKTTRWPESSYIYYEYFHNIFEPHLRVKLGKTLSDSDINNVVKELNEILVNVDKLIKVETFPESELLIYNTLYTLLEPVWYSKGLSPSLADTRTPTHTIFDHLYASVSVSNMLLNGKSGIDGFYVIIDFPGIQRFVNAGRKAGDIWASSWLLSNLIWSINEYFMNIYGYDVIISPTPRLNPYTLRTLLSRLLNLRDQGYCLITELEKKIEENKELKNTIWKIIEFFEKIYGIEKSDRTGIQRMWLQPLIPATTTLLIPRIKLNGVQSLETEDDVARKIDECFVEAWKKIVEFVESKLTSGSSVLHQIMGGLLKSVKNILDTPFQGINIAVVRIADVYDAIKKCIIYGEKDICEELGLKINLQSPQQLGIELEKLAKSLIWHVLVTRSTSLARIDKYGKFYNYMLRPFWTYSGGQLNPVDERLMGFSGDWIPCSLCGQEPAYIVLRKDVKIPNQVAFRIETFRIEDVEKLLTITGVEDRVSAQSLIPYVFKPGEALGPYCILKRSLYISLRDHLEILSTDDVALSAISEFLKKLNWLENLKVKADMKGLKGEDIEYLFTAPSDVSRIIKKPFKDIYALAVYSNINYEDFVKKITEYLVETCRESGVKPEDFLNNIVSVIGVSKNSSIFSLIKTLAEKREINLNNLCQFLSLRTQYAIVKGDADNIGKIMMGEMFGKIDEYKEIIVESIKNNGKPVGSEEVYESLNKGYGNAAKIIKALGLKSLPLSPAMHQALSLSLMLTAISDYRIVREGNGFLIYSGGDDVLAFLPVETAINTVIKLREEFYSDGFKKINNIPVASSILTGRSFSIRFANILDVMSTEIFNTIEYLEKRAKKARWSISGKSSQSGKFVCEKDTLVVTSSRSGIGALFPLKISIDLKQDDNVKEILDLIREILRETPLLLLTVLSSNIPEDYYKLVKDYENYMDSNTLYSFFEYVLKRNVKLKSTASSESVLAKLYGIFSNIKDLNVCIRGDKSTAIQEYVKFILVLRGVL
ncbi:MAG: type III-B CRISPR-associated protein Cas10/Cmr2 [Desulfurococcaceae archaeon]